MPLQPAVAASFPTADKIVLVQDKLNTHNASCFTRICRPRSFLFGAEFEMHYTPKKGSWLNMAELELSALPRICLSRRIPSIEQLDHEVQSLVKERTS